MVLKILFFLFVFSLGIFSCGTDVTNDQDAFPSETPAEKGASLYTLNCASCHGDDGNLGMYGAKDLSASKLSYKEVMIILKNGKNAMPPMSAILETQENMNLVIQHVISLRK